MIRTKTTQVKEGVMRTERFTPNGTPIRFDIIRAERGYQFYDRKTKRYKRFGRVLHGTDLSDLQVISINSTDLLI